MADSHRIDRISVFGLGKLGAVIAGCHADRGFGVVGVDVNRTVVEQVDRGRPPVQEPGIDELYRSAAPRLSATLDPIRAVLDTNATLIVVPTPSDPDGGYSLEYAIRACTQIGTALRQKDGYHLVVMKSTVLPGASDAALIPALERASGRSCGRGFGFSYNPEFIALGNVIRNIFEPDLVLAGESDPIAGNLVQDLYTRLLERIPPIARMNVVNAEIAKLSVNTFVTMKISFANSLARICERLPGGNVDVVTEAIGRDSRIGSRYLRGGLGFGGPCFPRDNRALLSLARRLGVPFHLAESTDATNLDPARQVVASVRERVEPGGRVAVLGLSYKPDTPVVDQSQGVFIARTLAEGGFAVTAYDPLAIDAARPELERHVKFAESAEAAIQDQDAVVVATPWREFASLDYRSTSRSSPLLVVDCWGLLSHCDGVDVVRLGVGLAPR